MTEALQNEMVSRWRGGASIRQIARDLQRSRHTVRRVIGLVEKQRSETPTARIRRPSLLDAFEPALRELLARYPNLTAVRLWEELKRQGFQGGYTLVRKRLRELRPQKTPVPVVRFETGPGQQAQMDYGTYDLEFSEEGRRRVYAFSYLLSYSRKQYLRFVDRQDFDTTLREHVRAFDHLGGVAAVCLYDNMKVVVGHYDGEVPIYNARFLTFATYYGFRPWACRPHRPQTKGKVERHFFYVEKSFLNGRTFRNLAHLNETAQWWLTHVADVRIHSRTKKTPTELFERERPHLIPLPAQAYQVHPVVHRVVDVEGFLLYAQNRYSAPWTHIGRTLPVRITETELILYDPHLQEIARHLLFPRGVTGQCRIDKSHRPSEDARKRQAQLHERFAELGEIAVRFLTGLLKEQRQGKDQAQRLLALLSTYHQADLVAACERAVRFGAYSFEAVQRILAVQAKPKSVLETLTPDQQLYLQTLIKGDPVAPRPAAAYRALLAEDSCHGVPPNPTENGSPGLADPSPKPAGENPDRLPGTADSPAGGGV